MSRLQRSWRTLRALSWTQRRLLAQAWLLLPLAAVGLRLFGFRRMQVVLHRPANLDPCQDDLPAAQAIARIVLSAARWNPVHASCLARSLVLCRLLRRQGLYADLRIGVCKPDGHFMAHAWVEHRGVALTEMETVRARYVTFDEAVLPEGT